MSCDTDRIPYDVVALGDLADDRYRVLADRVRERLQAFECARSTHLQSFARSNVHRYEGHGHSRTYVLITPTPDGDVDVPAFFTVGMTALDLSAASRAARKKLMGDISLDQTGAYSLAELARSDNYGPEQLPGNVILDEAKEVVKRARQYVAGRFLVVDARPEVFQHLYQPAGFREIKVAKAPRGMEDTDFITACAVIKDW